MTAVSTSRRPQVAWAGTSLAARLAILARFRHGLARDAETLADSIGRTYRGGRAESLSAEVLPLADACRWLEREAPRVLKPQALGRRGRPAWLMGAASTIHRDPLGLILILAPSNYPLMLPGVQALQALAAGNAVLVKPAPGCSAPMRQLADLLIEAGLDADLFAVLDEDVASFESALRAGVDKVVLTGSATTGRAVLAGLAETLTPSVMELSGCDAVFVRSDADLELVAKALRFGLTLNGSRTCIAPRRVFVPRALMPALEEALQTALRAVPLAPPPQPQAELIRHVVEDAQTHGARLVVGELTSDALRMPLVLGDVEKDMLVARTDVFAPILSLLPVEDDEDALRQARHCPYALGASVFGERVGAEQLANRVKAGLVTVNDLIVPSADPRLPFGGRGESGFGSTRGPDGLLEMTAPKAVVVRRARARPHFEPLAGNEDAFFAAWIRVAHGASWIDRFRGVKRLMQAGRALQRGPGEMDGEGGDER